MFFKIGVLKNVASLGRKHLCQSLFLIKLKPENFVKKTLQQRSYLVKFAECLRKYFFTEHLFTNPAYTVLKIWGKYQSKTISKFHVGRQHHGELTLRRCGMFHLRRNCNVAGMYREMLLWHRHDILMPGGNFTKNSIADVPVRIFPNNIHSCFCCFHGLFEILNYTIFVQYCE